MAAHSIGSAVLNLPTTNVQGWGAAAQPLNIAVVLNRDALSDRADDETRRFLAAHDHPQKERILRELEAKQATWRALNSESAYRDFKLELPKVC